MTRRRLEAALWGLSGAVLVVALGAYNGQIASAERGSFTMNFPAEGSEVGGPSPRELTGFIVVGVDGAGFAKRWIQPHVVEISSHVVRNAGDRPRTIRFEAEGFPEGAEWHSRDLSWNAATRAIGRPIAPGEAVDVGVTVTLPRPLPEKPVLLDGKISVLDADTGAVLSTLPVKVVRAPAAGAASGDCCE